MTSTMEFGPQGNKWYYHRESKTYDLTRGRKRSITMAASLTPPGTSVAVSTETTALVIVDMQNFFLDPKCGSHPKGLKAATKIKEVVAKCRESGIQVIWLNWGLEENDLARLPAALQRSFTRSLIDPSSTALRIGLGSDLGQGMGRTLMAGEWNSAIWPPLDAIASPNDAHCNKTRLSGLWNNKQPLWKHLTQKGISTLMFAGIQTDQCVLGTLTDAYSAGWDCILIEDCCATTTEGAQDVCRRNVALSYGFVVTAESILRG